MLFAALHMSAIGTKRTLSSWQSMSAFGGKSDIKLPIAEQSRWARWCQVSPSDRHAAELTLLSVVGAQAATLCCEKER